MPNYSDQSKDILKEILKTLKKGLGGKSDLNKLTITTNSTQYSAGDCIGGVLTLNTLDSSNKTGIIYDVLLKDSQDQKADIEILIFDKHPVDVGGATCTNNAAFDYGNSLPFLIGKVVITSSDYSTIDSIASVSVNNIGLLVKTDSDGPLYIVLVTSSTPTFTNSSTDLSLIIGTLKD